MNNNYNYLNVTCHNCNKLFHLKPSQLKKYNNHYCSNDCKYKSFKILYKGSGNHQFGKTGELNSSFKHYDFKDKVCCICNSDYLIKKIDNNFYCNRHYRQFLKYKKIIKTIFDRNIIVINNEYAEMFLLDKTFNIVAKTIFDIDEIDKIKKYKWHYSNGYATTRINKQCICMHQLITGNNIDHINKDKLCNLKSNFRIVNKSQNMMNSNISKKNKTGVKGVSWDKYKKKWKVTICKNYKKIVQYSIDFHDAVKKRLILEALLFQKYSSNFNHDTNLIELNYSHLNENKLIKINLKGEVIYEKN
jgi:hypothetical protein